MIIIIIIIAIIMMVMIMIIIPLFFLKSEFEYPSQKFYKTKSCVYIHQKTKSLKKLK